jgi:flagellar biosynthesis protein FlhF
MNHKKFWGHDISEALRAVRGALGADALIMETKNLPRALGGGVEITALSEGPVAEEETDPEIAARRRAPAHPMDELCRELASLKSMLGWLAPKLHHQDKIVQALVHHGVAPEIIGKLSDAMGRASDGEERERWYKAIAGLVITGGEILPAGDRLALIGPAGVGKTQTLIKLTILETQRRACRAGWINLDSRRLTVGDPLAVYAGILGARYERAANRKELNESLERLAECDLILIDTPGVNPRDQQGVKELAKLFQNLTEVRRALVLSPATHDRDLAEWAATLSQIGLQSLIFSKLDECRYFGPLLNTALAVGVPVAYLTFGQNLAGDLEIARPEIFASLLFTGNPT